MTPHVALATLNGNDETFDELLLWLINERRQTIQGVQLWTATDAAEEAHEERKELK